MPVWSEPARHVVNSAPTIHNIINDFNWNTIIRVAVTAFQASTSLAELASDALVAITGYWPPNLLQGFPMPLAMPPIVASDNDAWDLILQLVYYADLVFRTAEAAIQITLLHGTPLHAAFVQNMHHIMICAFLAADHLRGTAAIVGIGNDPVLLNFTAALAGTNAAGAQCPPLSGLGTVELLCRIIARGCLNMRELLASPYQSPKRPFQYRCTNFLSHLKFPYARTCLGPESVNYRTLSGRLDGGTATTRPSPRLSSSVLVLMVVRCLYSLRLSSPPRRTNGAPSAPCRTSPRAADNHFGASIGTVLGHYETQ